MKRYYRVSRYGHQTLYESSEELFDDIFDPEQYEDNGSTDDYLDDEYGSIDIAGQTFYASSILSALDERLYCNELRADAERYANDLRNDYEDQILAMKNGEIIEVSGYKIKCEINDNENEDYPEIDKQEFYDLLNNG